MSHYLETRGQNTINKIREKMMEKSGKLVKVSAVSATYKTWTIRFQQINPCLINVNAVANIANN